MPSPMATKRKSDDAFYIDEVQTPTGSPPTKKLRITGHQKQALIDNLQLEITERARKLRAQYALQANDLRARIERRVNRIPVALRKANMGELLEKHNNFMRAQQEGVSTRKVVSPIKGKRNATANSAGQGSSAANVRRAKKQSHEGLYSDKENNPAAGEPVDGLKNPKKRGAAAGTSRVVSQEMRGADYRILSPKSSNSRTYPQSPFRPSPGKQQHSTYLSQPMSPLKPTSPLKATSGSVTADGTRNRTTKNAASTSRPASQQSKRPASRAATGSRAIRSPLPRPATRQGERKNSTGTVSSTASSGTTVVKPTRTGTGARKATNASTTSSTVPKKTAAARNQAPTAAAKRNTASSTRKATAPAGGEAAAAGRRTLRKRA